MVNKLITTAYYQFTTYYYLCLFVSYCIYIYLFVGSKSSKSSNVVFYIPVYISFSCVFCVVYAKYFSCQIKCFYLLTTVTTLTTSNVSY